LAASIPRKREKIREITPFSQAREKGHLALAAPFMEIVSMMPQSPRIEMMPVMML